MHRIVPGLVSAAIVVVIGVSLWRSASALLTDGKERAPKAARRKKKAVLVAAASKPLCQCCVQSLLRSLAL